jgi:ATP-dependent exoDNAse (exonuclease V) beta subunit
VSKFWRQEKTYEMYARYIDRIFDMAERWRDQYARFKQEKNLLDYDDMEKYMWQLLQREDVCREIEAGYQYLFVDEFQDSSPIQLKIFDRLSELMTHSFWVGDYKQAIFAFRGSDPDLTKAVVDHIAEDPQRIQTLDTSYRSLPELVALNNRIFTETFKKLLKPEEVQLQAHRENLAGKQCLYYFPKEEDGEFNAIARAVKGLLDQGAQPGEIAVLARRNTELDKIVPALNALHIPANRAEIAVVDTDTYTLVRSLLRLVDNPTNTLAKAAIAYIVDPAATPEYLIEEKIRQDAASGVYLDEQPMVQKLLGIRDRLRQQSVTTMVDTLIIELGLHDEALKYELNVEIAESVLDVIVCTAQVYEQHCVQLNMPSTIEGFIAYIENLKPKGTGAADGVQLVTYHKSKGLQWKYTILTSLDNSVTNKLVPNEVFGVHFAYTERPTKDNPYPEVYIRVAPYLLGNRKMDDGISLIIADSAMYKEIEARCTNEANRLLYVGMTRARDVLLLEHPGKTGFRWFNDIGWIMDPANEGFAEFPLPEVPQDDEAAPVVRQRLKREATTFEVREPRYISPSGVVGLGEVGEHRDFGQRITTHDIRDDQMMAHVGDCVHQIYAGLDTVREPELPKIQELIHAYGLTAVLTQPTEIVRAWRNLVDYLTEHHGAATAVYHERPFRLERDGQTVVGSMDLVWQTAEGDILVDFKTCPMGKSVLDPQNEHFVGRYAGQLNAYTEALVAAGERVVKRYIYYAISGIIAEVK